MNVVLKGSIGFLYREPEKGALRTFCNPLPFLMVVLTLLALNPKALRTHISRLLGLKTILHMAFGPF